MFVCIILVWKTPQSLQRVISHHNNKVLYPHFLLSSSGVYLIGILPLISVDMHGSNNTIPLSPQWRLPKLGENKAGIVTGVCHYLFFY